MQSVEQSDGWLVLQRTKLKIRGEKEKGKGCVTFKVVWYHPTHFIGEEGKSLNPSPMRISSWFTFPTRKEQ